MNRDKNFFFVQTQILAKSQNEATLRTTTTKIIRKILIIFQMSNLQLLLRFCKTCYYLAYNYSNRIE